jgi:hypothetical protein
MKKLLFRQVHPDHNKNGLSSGAFRPTPNDEGLLSVDCSEIFTSQVSYETHLQKTKPAKDGKGREFLKTDGTWAISRDSCVTENLPVSYDPVKDEPYQPENIAHHLIDYNGVEKTKIRNLAKRLRDEADKIGKLWPK